MILDLKKAAKAAFFYEKFYGYLNVFHMNRYYNAV